MRNLFSLRSFGRIKPICVHILLLQIISQCAASPEVNYWTNTTSGNWQENHWSLGKLPDSSQSVAIVSPGFKAVAINPATVQNYPSSLTVSGLTISSETNGENTLILNYSGTDVPLRSLNGLGVSSNAMLINLSSGLIVENGTFGITNGQVFQDGGFVTATNNVNTYITGAYELTNGIFQASDVWLGFYGLGTFNQYGGDATMRTLGVGAASTPYSEGHYRLYDGHLLVSSNLHVGGYNNPAYFDQHGGTNEVGYLNISPVLGGAGYYSLDGGTVLSDHVLIAADDYARGGFTNNGSIHVVTNDLRIYGATIHGSPGRDAAYALNNGTLMAGSITLDGSAGYSVFVQSNGLTHVSGTVQLNIGNQTYNGKLTLAGGTFACAETQFGGGGVDILQTDGALVVTNLFSFGGFTQRALDGFALYTFSGGTLTASNIDFEGEWNIGSSTQANRITNPGYFKFRGKLITGTVQEQLGRFILSSNSIIDLQNGDSKLSFANSSGESWSNGAELSIQNWNGAANGGGDDQLKFGNNQGGLTSDQLNQIRFANPAGFEAGTYAATQLSTGEIVPTTSSNPALMSSVQGNKMIFNWSAPYTLQHATNVMGPYVDVPEAISPYTNSLSNPREFFRLRQ